MTKNQRIALPTETLRDSDGFRIPRMAPNKRLRPQDIARLANELLAELDAMDDDNDPWSHAPIVEREDELV